MLTPPGPPTLRAGGVDEAGAACVSIRPLAPGACGLVQGQGFNGKPVRCGSFKKEAKAIPVLPPQRSARSVLHDKPLAPTGWEGAAGFRTIHSSGTREPGYRPGA